MGEHSFGRICIREGPVIEAFGLLFAEPRLSHAIRSDNGLPFASPNGLSNLSKLSVWWLRLGILTGRIKSGHPSRTAGKSACI